MAVVHRFIATHLNLGNIDVMVITTCFISINNAPLDYDAYLISIARRVSKVLFEI